MSERVFFDTNVLVYVYDADEGRRQRAARKALAGLWDSPVRPAISVQVLQELYVTLLRKGMKGMEAEEIVQNHLAWDVVSNTPSLLMSAIRMQQDHQLSFWDASVLAAAREVKADVLWTEDFADGRCYGDVTVRNPLAE
jgi:predicted nucleic acid-binding protein